MTSLVIATTAILVSKLYGEGAKGEAFEAKGIAPYYPLDPALKNRYIYPAQRGVVVGPPQAQGKVVITWVSPIGFAGRTAGA